MKTMKKMLSLGLALVLMLCLLPYSAYGEGETAPVGEGSDVQTDEPAEKRVPSGPLAKQVPRRPAAPSAYAQGETSSEEKGDKPAENTCPAALLPSRCPAGPRHALTMRQIRPPRSIPAAMRSLSCMQPAITTGSIMSM